jgi:L-iditol 2-dehydrogenase
MTEPLACVLHGVARSDIQPADRVVVMGDGAIGLMFVAVLAAFGRQEARGKRQEEMNSTSRLPVEVFLFGGNDRRLQIGEQLGASRTFNYHQLSDVPTVVRDLTEGWGADVVIEATGVPAVWESAIACGRPGATINLFGGCPRDTTITISTEQLHYNELTLKGVFHNTPGYVREALSVLASREIPFERLISDHRPLKDLEQAFQDMKNRQAIKVAIEPGT